MNWWDGQERRAWLDRQNENIGNALRYYLGPAAEPVNALTQAASWFSPGADMVDMAQSSDDLMQSGGGWDTVGALGGLGTGALGMIFPPAAKVDDVLDFVRGGRAVYHSATADAAEDIHKYGVEPQHGPWVQEVLAGSVDDDDQMREMLENSPPAAWWSDAPDWIEAKVRRITGRHDVTEDDIRQYGHLAIADPEDYASEMYRIGDEGLDDGPYSWVTDLEGKRQRFYETPLVDGEHYPFGIERNEIVTGASVEPKFSLTGDELVDFMKRFPGSGGQPTNALSGIRAYHGSPHDFDRFSMDKIGTGEGAQAYGHGLYFAENEGVAKSYKEALANRKYMPGDGASPLKTAWSLVSGSAERAAMPTDDLMPFVRNAWPDASDAELRAAIDEAKSAYGPGHMYEVNINANPDDFLDWDKPLSEQSEKVRAALADNWLAHPVDHAKQTGRETYMQLPSEYVATAEQARERATAALREAGIPGIRYLDQGSRGAGQGSHNYVVFSADIIDILRKYGLAGLLAGGAAGNALTSGEERY